MKLDRVTIPGTLRVLGGLHTESVSVLREALLEGLTAPGDLVVDLTAVDMCDSAALQLLLACRRSAEALGKPCRLALSSFIKDTAVAIGVEPAEWADQIISNEQRETQQ